jgi:lysophospholipase L1-like esterase
VRQETDEWFDETSIQISAALDAGLDVLDIRSAYAEISALETLWLAPWDSHPNVQGHQLLANAILKKLEPTIRSYSTH